MGLSDQVSLGSLRIQARQRSDMENNNAITDSEFNSYVSSSYKRLYNILIAAYGNDYYVANTYQFQTTSSQSYPLPDGTTHFLDSSGQPASKFYKLLGVDLQYSGTPSGWLTLNRFEMIERNKYAYPNSTVSWAGYTNLRYRLSGDNLYIVPLPQTGQGVRLWYAPAPTSLQYYLTCSISLSSSVIGVPNTVGLSTGMTVYGDNIVSGTTISTINSSSNQITVSNGALASTAAQTLSFWNDSTLISGVAGWEEYIVIDAAIKAGIKQENDISGLINQRNDMTQEIQGMAEGRDIGAAMHTSDALGANGGLEDGGGWGGSDGWGGY